MTPEEEKAETRQMLGELLEAVEAGRQGVGDNLTVHGDPELSFNGALFLIVDAVAEMNRLQPGAGEAWLEGFRKIARGERP